MPKQLTEKMVERLKIMPRAYTTWDARQTGLGIKITPTGKRLWQLQLRYPGHRVQTKRTLGSYPAMSLQAARAKAAEWYSLVRQSIDPKESEAEKARAADAVRRAAAQAHATTFSSVAERFINEHVTKQRRGGPTAREIRNYLVNAWGVRPVASITPRDVKELIGKLKANAPYQARNVLGHASTLFKWAVFHDLLDVSPVASLEARWVLSGVQIGPRQRVLNELEIAAFWRAAERLGYPYGPLFKLLLLTGCRRNEAAQARWPELHPEIRKAIRSAAGAPVDWSAAPATAKVLTVPRERFKSDSEHCVALSDDALRIIESLPRFTGGDYLFTMTSGIKPVNGFSNAKARLDELMLGHLRAMARLRGEDPQAIKLTPFILHDLRRVARTNLAALDVADHVAEMVLGHGRKGLQRVYDQHKYEGQIREALDRWAARLRTMVALGRTPPAPADLVTLRARP
jgi:integrase